MVLWHHSTHSTPASAASSRPSSRAPSPTRTNSRISLNSANSIPVSTPGVGVGHPSRSNTIDSTDPLNDFLGGDSSSSIAPGTSPALSSHLPSTSPAYPFPSSDMWRGSDYGTHTPGGYFQTQPVEIVLDAENLVLRGQGGDMNPAYLSGRVDLNLNEATNIKEITMALQGKAKVSFTEPQTGRNHHYTHPIIHHDWSFLEGAKKHTHTLKAGHHSFPFSLMLDGSLPSTISTYTGDATISYKLRATVVRSGFTASNYTASKTFSLHRTYTPDALEFNQTLEIENTWPGKIMYALTLPFKAYAAGDEIPVAVKFMPLAKGVRVLSVTSVIKEYSLVHTRHSSHPDSRVAASTKHELRDGRAIPVLTDSSRPPAHSNLNLSHTSSRHDSSAGNSRHPSPSATPMASTRGLPSLTSANAGPSASTSRAGASAQAGGSSTGNAVAGPSTAPAEEELDEDVEIGDDEVNTSFTVTVPPWTTPSHSVHPVFITHKIKWSCSISNPDGHISELRCALPIIILEHSLLDEARAAGAATRALLFGGHAEEGQQVDLPSYSNHVYDRVAADSGATTGYVARSTQHTPLPSPRGETPPHSVTPSRPSSPTRDRAFAAASAAGGVGPGPEVMADSEGDVPPRRELTQWTDSELLLSLGALRVHSTGTSPSNTPPDSRAPSRPLSRRNSRSGRSSLVGSRANSRASSPERHSASSSYVDERPINERRGSGFAGRLHLLRPLSGAKPILRNTSGVSLSSPIHAHNEGIQRNAQSFTNLSNGHVSFGGETRRHFIIDPDEEVPAISRVPAYDIASRGFAGALDAGPPTYDDSERMIETRRSEADLGRARSDTALVELGAAAAAEAEERAAEQEQEQEQEQE